MSAAQELLEDSSVITLAAEPRSKPLGYLQPSMALSYSGRRALVLAATDICLSRRPNDQQRLFKDPCETRLRREPCVDRVWNTFLRLRSTRPRQCLGAFARMSDPEDEQLARLLR